MVTVIVILFLIAILQRVLPRFSVQRSVTTSMIFLGIILLGFISVSRLPQELFPPITYPQLTVATSYANAAPEEIETLITKIIEEAISTVKNIKEIRSVSKEGLSLVIADFAWDTDMNIAALNMREKIDLVKEMLPRDAEEPIVLKFNPYALPILMLSVTGEQPPEELLSISKKVIKDKLEKIEGVASANVTGGKEREIKIEIDMAQLKGAHTDLLAIVEAIKNANLNYPAGTTKEKFYEYLLRTVGEYTSIEEISQTPVTLYDLKEEERKKREGERSTREIEKRTMHTRRPILLKDVAEITDSFKEPTSYSRYNNKDNITISIQKQADANTIRTVERVRKELQRIADMIPENVNVEVVYDESTYIKSSIHGVANAAWQGGILAFIVLLIFLRNFLIAFIVTISIPISIFATFSLMYFQGLSINMMSLGGLALGVGMLVDNAIVAIENIYRYRELGHSKKDSSITGTEQVAGPIVASTLTTVAVFLPMVFLAGVAGQIFRDLSFTIAFALTASMFVALSLIPLLTSRGRKSSGALNTKGEVRFDFIPYLVKLNGIVLDKFMKRKFIGLIIVGLVFLGSLLLIQTVDRELMPKVDTGELTLKINFPTGTKLEVTNNITKNIEKHLLQQPDTDRVATIVGSSKKKASEAAYETLGSHQAQIMIKLKKDRQLATSDYVQQLKAQLNKLVPKYVNIDYLMKESLFSAGAETAAPIVVKLHGPNLNKLNALAEKVTEKLKTIPGLDDIKNTIASTSPETRIIVDKDKASIYSINVRDIAQTSLIAVKGLTASKFKEEGNEYDINVKLSERYREDLTDLKGILIYSPQKYFVSLNELARLSPGRGPSEIKRFDQQRVIFISANLLNESLNTASKKVGAIISDLKIPDGYSVELIGESEEAKQSFKNLMFILILSFTLVYMIMASQFESTWQPFVIMFTVPFSIIGVSLALVMTNTTLNIVAILGIIILGGVVVNNAIVLIEYINETRSKGKELVAAAIEASKIRLRPILMTALTTVLGLIPMAIATGEGSELRSPLAIAVMGGLIVATMLTLWVIPVIFVIVAGSIDKFKSRFAK